MLTLIQSDSGSILGCTSSGSVAYGTACGMAKPTLHRCRSIGQPTNPVTLDRAARKRARSGHRTPASGGYAWGYRGGYAWGFRIPQLYPPARVQISPQIQDSRRSLGDQNQPRLAPRGSAPGAPNLPLRAGFIFQKSLFLLRPLLTMMAFSQMDVVASLGGTVEMEPTWLCITWLHIGKRRKDRHELCSFVGDWDGEQDSSLKCKDPRFCLQQFRFW